MTKEEMAFRIFLKRMPISPLTDVYQRAFKASVEESWQLAEMFMQGEIKDEAEEAK